MDSTSDHEEEQFEFPLDSDLIWEKTDFSIILEPSKTQGGLYLGNFKSTRDISYFCNNNINAILDVAGNKVFYSPSIIAHSKSIDVKDMPTYDLSAHFQECFDFIEEHRSQGIGVLVHCMAGVSRSAAVIIGYLISRMDMDLETAYKYVQRRRTCIEPNKGFLRQLRRLEKELKSKREELQKELEKLTLKEPCQFKLE